MAWSLIRSGVPARNDPNVYTDPDYRRCGIARQLMATIITWCKQQGFARVTLHASGDGRQLYESLGFVDSNEMRLGLR